MRISCIRPSELGEDQISAWRYLQQGIYDHPFFSPEYTRLVSEVRDDVRVAVIEDGGETIGFFPFQRGPRGIGQPVGSRLTDFQGPILQDVGLDVPLLLRSCGLNTWQFDHLVPSSSALQTYCYGTAGSPYIDLSDGIDAYRQGRRQAGSSVIKQLDRQSRKLAREIGPLRFEMHSTDRQVFETLIQWKSDYIRRKGAFRMLDTPWILDSLERIWQTDTPDLAGQLSALYAGDHLIGVHLGICNQRVCHWWIPTYDVQYHRYSPGAILLMQFAAAAAAAGMKRIDLGKGDEPYKLRMMSGEVQLGEGTLTGSPFHRAIDRAWFHTRSKLRDSALRPIVQKSKQVLRYGPWFRKSSDGKATDA